VCAIQSSLYVCVQGYHMCVQQLKENVTPYNVTKCIRRLSN